MMSTGLQLIQAGNWSTQAWKRVEQNAVSVWYLSSRDLRQSLLIMWNYSVRTAQANKCRAFKDKDSDWYVTANKVQVGTFHVNLFDLSPVRVLIYYVYDLDQNHSVHFIHHQYFVVLFVFVFLQFWCKN